MIYVKIIIWGAGELGKSVYHILKQTGSHIEGFIDDYKTGEFLGLPILGTRDYLSEVLPEQYVLAIAIGYNHFCARQEAFELCKRKEFELVNAIHPTAVIDKSVQIGEGTVCFAGVIIDHHVQVGNNVLVNTGSVISHDTTIGDYSFIGPGVRIAGDVVIGKRVFIGIGSTIIEYLNIGDDALIGGGTIVIRNVPTGDKQVGVPAKSIAGKGVLT